MATQAVAEESSAIRSPQASSILQSPAMRDELARFEAPYVIWKLLLNRSVRTEAEARFLFEELKRFFLVCEAARPRWFPMYSLRVDEAWHQFVLFSRKYEEFCQHFFGRFLPHQPKYQVETRDGGLEMWEEFVATYQAIFGVTPPKVWEGWSIVYVFERIRYERVESRFRVQLAGDKAELVLLAEQEEPLLRIDRHAEPALRFVAEHDIFYVRELPGLDDEHKVALARALLSTREFCLAL